MALSLAKPGPSVPCAVRTTAGCECALARKVPPARCLVLVLPCNRCKFAPVRSARRARAVTHSLHFSTLIPWPREDASHASEERGVCPRGARRREPAMQWTGCDGNRVASAGRADQNASIARPGGLGKIGVLVEARACLPCFHIRSSSCELLCTVCPQIPVVDHTKILRRLAHSGAALPATCSPSPRLQDGRRLRDGRECGSGRLRAFCA